MEKYLSIENLFNNAAKQNKKVWEYVLEDQSISLGISKEKLFDKMKDRLNVMLESVKEGMNEKHKLKIESNEDNDLFREYIENDKSIIGKNLGLIASRAIAVASLNASMGRIVACPTAGSAGILPAVLSSLREIYYYSTDDLVKALFTSSAVGMVFSNVTGTAGATGGCQAECGVAEAMASVCIVELRGGNTQQIKNAISFCIKTIEGLVCDPVAGLVECPCIKRNAICAINAVVCADMALSGMKSAIPVDEVILAMKQVGKIMDERLRETATGGLSVTDTGIDFQNRIFS